MNIMIELLKQKIAKIKDTATERSYYPLLCAFFEEYAKSNVLKLRNPQATPKETSTKYEHRIGFPDITIRNGNDLIGWVEMKIPQENLNAEKFQAQFSKYKESLENIIFTNLRDWQLWQWKDDEAKKTADIAFDLTDISNASSEEFEQFLIKFFEGRAYQTRTPKQLALALAKKTRLLSQQVEEALNKSEADSDLQRLKETFEKTLIQDISEHQFANMVAETMAYSLFLAALEHSRRGTGTFLMSAIQEIHGNIKKENASLGDEMVAREFNRVILSHILKHFYGFELLIAPYAIAHLKLTLEVERLGFDFANSKDDNDKDNDRFKVYLANTLDDPNKPPQKLFGFDSIPQESENAREVKKNVPILAIVGNPPYSNFGRMNRGEWILNLRNDYEQHFH